MGLEGSAAEGHPTRKGCASRQQRMITAPTFLWSLDVSDYPVLLLVITFQLHSGWLEIISPKTRHRVGVWAYEAGTELEDSSLAIAIGLSFNNPMNAKGISGVIQ